MSSATNSHVFRKSDSNLLCPVWQAIEDTSGKQVADFKHIARQLKLSHLLGEYESLELLDNMCDDGLVILDPKTGVYSLPKLEKSKNKHRWDILQSRDCYCYECHGAGSVLACVDCPRVFHVGCIRPDDEVDLPLLPFAEPVPQFIQNTFIQVYGYLRRMLWQTLKHSWFICYVSVSDQPTRRSTVEMHCPRRNRQKHDADASTAACANLISTF